MTFNHHHPIIVSHQHCERQTPNLDPLTNTTELMQTRAKHRRAESTPPGDPQALEDNPLSLMNTPGVLKTADPSQTKGRRTMKKDRTKQIKETVSCMTPMIGHDLTSRQSVQEFDIAGGENGHENPPQQSSPQKSRNLQPPSAQLTPIRSAHTLPPSSLTYQQAPPSSQLPAHAERLHIEQTGANSSHSFLPVPPKFHALPQLSTEAAPPRADSIAMPKPVGANPPQPPSSLASNSFSNAVTPPPAPVLVQNFVGTTQPLPHPPLLHDTQEHNVPSAMGAFTKTGPFAPVTSLPQNSRTLPVPPFTPRSGLPGLPADLTPTKASRRIFVSASHRVLCNGNELTSRNITG